VQGTSGEGVLVLELQNGWFTMENPKTMMILGYPHFRNHHIVLGLYTKTAKVSSGNLT
jgi:hypothetical protein